MVRLSINELTTYRWSFEEDVRNYHETGIQAISVWRHKLSDFGEEKGIELLADAGLDVASLLWAGGFTGSDGRSYRESVDDAVEAIRLASGLKADCLSVFSGARAGHTHNHARRLLNSALAELLPVARELAVTLALEPVHAGCAQEWTFLTDLAEVRELVERYADPRLQLALDTYYFGSDPAVRQDLARLVPHLALVHLGDGRREPDGEQDRCALGEGVVPLGDIIPTLLQAGYKGYFDVQLMGQEIETSDYHQLLATCRDRFGLWSRDVERA